MLDLIGTVASGGVLGLAGSVINKSLGFVDQYQQAKFKQLEWAHELKLLEMQQKSKEKELENEAKISEDRLYSEVRAESYKHDSNIGIASLWVINILRLVRPFLTIGLVLLTSLIWFSLDNHDNGLRQNIIDTILFCTTASLTWWFGDRWKKNG